MVLFLAFTLPLIISLLLTPIVRKLAFHFKIVDTPNVKRKIHSKPMPLLGGVVIFFSVAISFLLFKNYTTSFDSTLVHSILFGAFVLMVGGILDDKYNLAPKVQIVFPFLASLIVIFSGLSIDFVSNPLGGILHVPQFIGVTLTFLWLMGMMYTTKLLDGLDGLVSGITVIGALIIFFVSLSWDASGSATQVWALILAGSVLGFLFYNFHPAKIFLGEGGSLLLGFFLAVLSIISGSKIATTLLIMGLFALDVAWVILKRLKNKKRPTLPGREHFHFRLLERGFSHRRAVLFLYGVSAIFGVSSLFFQTRGKIVTLIVLFVLSIFLMKYFDRKKS